MDLFECCVLCEGCQEEKSENLMNYNNIYITIFIGNL